jgi:hypothetical protein
MDLNFDTYYLSILVTDATYVIFGIINDLTIIIFPTIVMFLFFQEFIIFSDFKSCFSQDKNLKGIQIKLDGRTHSLKLSQLADDTTVFVQSKMEISIAYQTKDRVTLTPLIPEGELRCSGRVSSSCSTSGTRRVNLVTSPVINHE